jgi:hypothetical protein
MLARASPLRDYEREKAQEKFELGVKETSLTRLA